MSLSEDLAGFIHHRPQRCLAIMLAVTMVISSGMYNFSMSMDMEDMFPKTEEVEYLKEVQEEFFDTEVASVLTTEVPVLSPVYFTEIADVIEAWLAEPDIRDALAADPMVAIMAIPVVVAQFDLMLDGINQPTMDLVVGRMRTYGTGEEIIDLAKMYLDDPRIPPLMTDAFLMLMPTDTPSDLSTVPEKGAVFVEVNGSLDIDAMTDVLLIMERLTKENTDSVMTYMYSDGLLGHYMAEAESQMEPIFLVLVVIMLLVLLLAFRRLGDTGITMVSLLIAVLWQVGLISWLGISLDLFQFMVPLMLIGLGVDFSLHLIVNYREGLSTPGTDEERLEAAVKRVFRVTLPALVLATVTTMVGFGSNMLFDYPAVFKFGLGAMLGIFAVLMVNLFFVLPWRVWSDRRRPGLIEKGAISVERMDRRPSMVVRGGFRSMHGAVPLMAALVLLAIPGLIIAPTMKGTYDPRDELIEDQDLSIAASTFMDEFYMGTETMFIRVVDDWTRAGSWDQLYQALDQLGGSDLVSKVDGDMIALWAGPFLPSYAMLDPHIAALWTNVTEDGYTVSPSASSEDIKLLMDTMYASFPEFSNYVHKEGDTYRSMVVSIPTKTNWGEKGLRLREDVDAAFEDRFEEYQPTGTPIVWGVAFDLLTSYMIQSITFVVVFAFGLLIVLNIVKRGDPILGIITGIPPIMVLGWMFLTMHFMGIPLNMMTSMVGAIVIGLGIDYPIHIVNRWVYEAEEGHDLRGVYNITLGSTGREIVFSGLTTLLALGTFFLLPMESMRVFGLVLFIALLFAMMGALVLTPLMLRFWHPRRVGGSRGGSGRIG